MKYLTITKSETIRETEKAILIKTLMDVGNKGASDKEIWLPKSQIKETEKGLAIPTWLAAQKESVTYMTYFHDVLRDKEMAIKLVEIN